VSTPLESVTRAIPPVTPLFKGTTSKGRDGNEAEGREKNEKEKD